MANGQPGRPKKIKEVVEDFDDILGEPQDATPPESSPIVDEEIEAVVEETPSEPVEEQIIQQNEIAAESDIQETVDVAPEGWTLIGDLINTHPPRNGMPVYISETGIDEGVLAFWTKTRAFANTTKRWEEHGKWQSFIAGMPVNMSPKYWRPRFAL